ncbi:hypothetical protein SAICODRAFT_171227 [Saitoella complicata NRRL Y-17804]|nr:uncharacterized protein SAICODRAFT_171227 [Saitoella complicata NRRL Y-17804]ODQ50612.1 hypothetical protein SAICODRAFT_171227 [Saitoella complicata NRRL Y-17804]
MSLPLPYSSPALTNAKGNVGRARSKRWAEAPTPSYEGDDYWSGSEDEYEMDRDEKERERWESSAPATPDIGLGIESAQQCEQVSRGVSQKRRQSSSDQRVREIETNPWDAQDATEPERYALHDAPMVTPGTEIEEPVPVVAAVETLPTSADEVRYQAFVNAHPETSTEATISGPITSADPEPGPSASATPTQVNTRPEATVVSYDEDEEAPTHETENRAMTGTKAANRMSIHEMLRANMTPDDSFMTDYTEENEESQTITHGGDSAVDPGTVYGDILPAALHLAPVAIEAPTQPGSACTTLESAGSEQDQQTPRLPQVTHAPLPSTTPTSITTQQPSEANTAQEQPLSFTAPPPPPIPTSPSPPTDPNLQRGQTVNLAAQGWKKRAEALRRVVKSPTGSEVSGANEGKEMKEVVVTNVADKPEMGEMENGEVHETDWREGGQLEEELDEAMAALVVDAIPASVSPQSAETPIAYSERKPTPVHCGIASLVSNVSALKLGTPIGEVPPILAHPPTADDAPPPPPPPKDDFVSSPLALPHITTTVAHAVHTPEPSSASSPEAYTPGEVDRLANEILSGMGSPGSDERYVTAVEPITPMDGLGVLALEAPRPLTPRVGGVEGFERTPKARQEEGFGLEEEREVVEDTPRASQGAFEHVAPALEDSGAEVGAAQVSRMSGFSAPDSALLEDVATVEAFLSQTAEPELEIPTSPNHDDPEQLMFGDDAVNRRLSRHVREGAGFAFHEDLSEVVVGQGQDEEPMPLEEKRKTMDFSEGMWVKTPVGETPPLVQDENRDLGFEAADGERATEDVEQPVVPVPEKPLHVYRSMLDIGEAAASTVPEVPVRRSVLDIGEAGTTAPPVLAPVAISVSSSPEPVPSAAARELSPEPELMPPPTLTRKATVHLVGQNVNLAYHRLQPAPQCTAFKDIKDSTNPRERIAELKQRRQAMIDLPNPLQEWVRVTSTKHVAEGARPGSAAGSSTMVLSPSTSTFERSKSRGLGSLPLGSTATLGTVTSSISGSKLIGKSKGFFSTMKKEGKKIGHAVKSELGGTGSSKSMSVRRSSGLFKDLNAKKIESAGVQQNGGLVSRMNSALPERPSSRASTSRNSIISLGGRRRSLLGILPILNASQSRLPSPPLDEVFEAKLERIQEVLPHMQREDLIKALKEADGDETRAVGAAVLMSGRTGF